MNDDDYDEAAEYWINKDKDNIVMSKKKLLEEILNYINSNNTCALATGNDKFVRCTPVEYSYYENCFWIFSEGGLKFVGLKENKNVCISIYDKYDGFGKLKGIQIMGKAEVIDPFSDEYNKIAHYKKLSLDGLKKLQTPINLIKIEPEEADFLNSDFKKNGYSSRQHFIF